MAMTIIFITRQRPGWHCCCRIWHQSGVFQYVQWLCLHLWSLLWFCDVLFLLDMLWTIDWHTFYFGWLCVFLSLISQFSIPCKVSTSPQHIICNHRLSGNDAQTKWYTKHGQTPGCIISVKFRASKYRINMGIHCQDMDIVLTPTFFGYL